MSPVPPPKKKLSRAEYARVSGHSLSTIDRYREKGFLQYEQVAKRHKVVIVLDADGSNGSSLTQQKLTPDDAKPKKPKSSGPRPRWMNES